MLADVPVAVKKNELRPLFFLWEAKHPPMDPPGGHGFYQLMP